MLPGATLARMIDAVIADGDVFNAGNGAFVFVLQFHHTRSNS
jgi:hypothetical protein